MAIKAGLVGLPNVGKSTLFNALTKSCVPAENYPFCTIDPHLAITFVPDERLQKLLALYKSQKIIPATVSFVDIAGLVKGAASGEGLGNQFLTHIRDVNVTLHVLRCFQDPDITHTSDKIDPISDYEIIMAELMLKDLDTIGKRIEKVTGLIKRMQSNLTDRKEAERELALLQQIQTALNASDVTAVRTLVKQAGTLTSCTELLSAKEFLIIANISEQELEHDAYKKNPSYLALVERFGAEKVVPIAAKTEYEISQLPEEEAHEFMQILGMKTRGLDLIIQKTYATLGLITFFTCGPKEIHAWPIKKDITIRQAAGEIHSDLERGFICAEVFNYTDLLAAGSEAKVKEIGKMRTEGQDYIVQDGDIVHIRFAV
jgi:GTP-binding protein YchF